MRIPDRLRLDGRTRPWVRQRGLPDTQGCFLEGPVFDGVGNLLCVDIAFGRVLAITPAGEVSVVAHYDGEPNGLAIRADGTVFIADARTGILALDPATSEVTPVLTELPDRPLKGPNDLVFADNGDLYFTDQGDTGLQDPAGRLVRLTPGGEVDIVLDNVPSPNGLVLTRDQRMLHLAVTRANAVWTVPLAGREPPTRVGLFIQLSGGPGGGPDGLAMDERGNLLVAHVHLGCVWVFGPLGEPRYRIQSCTGTTVTNVTTGPDRRSVYLTESASGCVLRARLPDDQ